MSTYAESKGKAPIDWNARLNTPVEQIKEKDARTWMWEARKSWVTCACGNQCIDIPRKDTGAPVDHKLNMLGVSFAHQVNDLYLLLKISDYDMADESLQMAKRVLAKIEKRSAEIIAEIRSQK